ncbi:hypothetical protein, conserved [Plasmodium gonderi]|uniref:Uncharacterized protein n=1 Tax=Plasmodium gonderi TaxID=77519 RepID=A0A1Y1JJT4_PLAGO|nr:hypothetical protein, conserved [Plasmodium gonderi]GAW82510.1 hypothetical protein, conserved [Plasmodium gonderi]
MSNRDEEIKQREEKSSKKNIDIAFDSEEMDIPVNKDVSKNQGEVVHEKLLSGVNIRNHKDKKSLERNNENVEKEKLLIFNNYIKKEGQNISNEIEEKQDKDKNSTKKEEHKSINEDEFEIPIQRKKRTHHTDFLSKGFFKSKDYEDSEENKRLHILDIFNYHDFPVDLFEKKKRRTKNREKKFVIEFVDTYNDEFVKKNINNNLIFESIGVCKGISFLHINKNINVNCLGSKDNNAFYFYKIIPFDKIYSKDTINKILSSKNMSSKNDEIKQYNNRKKELNTDNAMHKENNDHEEYNPFLKNYNMIKNYLFNKRKEKKTLYNDLYLSPYEKNLKSSICIGTHIYSKERAVKKCFGLLIEQNVYSIDQTQDENTSVNKNLENLYFDFPFYKNKITFKPIYYPYKNIPVVSDSFQNYYKNIQWEEMTKLKDPQFYYDIKNSFFNFSKDVYLTTKGAIKQFDSPKDFIFQTANRMKDINFQMMKICERSFDIIHDSVMKLSQVSKSS